MINITASTVGFSLGNDHFTDLDYADDVALLAHAVDDSTSIPLWTFLTQQRQNLVYICVLTEDEVGAGESNTSISSVSGHSVGKVTEFTYLGSVLFTIGRSQPDVFRRIDVASYAMYSMNTD